MKKLVFAVCLLCTSMFFACGNGTANGGENDSDSVTVDSVVDSVEVVDSVVADSVVAE